jgi:hypothetical protein
MMPEPPAQRRRGNVAPAVLAVLVVVLMAAGLATVAARTGDDERALAGARAGGFTQATEPTAPPPTAAPEPSVPPPVPPGTPSLPHVPAAQRAALEELMVQVAELRGLAWKEPLNLRVVPRDEMVRRLRAANARDSDPAQVAAEEATLKLLGLIPADLDYARLLDDLMRAAVLGFYDPETKELYVAVADTSALQGAEKATIVHEMVHALTDQHFGYGPKTIALDKADKAEEYLAFAGLLEGDARLTETLWIERHLSEIEALAALLGEGSDIGEGLDVLSRTPAYVQRALFFPYEAGLEFVERLHSAGGFEAVNAAYRRPPASTEQILHPETYAAAHSTAPPPLPDLAAATGCARVRTGALGEFDMRALLDQHGADTSPTSAAAGWNGDAYAVLRCGGALALADRWQTDPGTDAGRLAEALAGWARAWSGGAGPGPAGRFAGPSGAGRIVRSGSRVDLVVAQTAEAADRLALALG